MGLDQFAMNEGSMSDCHALLEFQQPIRTDMRHRVFLDRRAIADFNGAVIAP